MAVRIQKRFNVKRAGRVASRVVIYAVLLVLALSMLIPFLWMVMTSFMNELEVSQYPPKLWPSKFLWSNYREALTLLPFGRFFVNSVIMSLGAVLLQLIVCSMAAFAFARLHFRGRDRIFGLYIATMMIPVIVTIIPAFLIVDAFGWVNTYQGLILYFASSVWGIFLLRQFFLTLPRDLEDAARIDGASTFHIYWRIALPLSKPALATLGIFSFMAVWRDFLWSLIVTTQMDMRPVEVGIAFFHNMHVTKWPYQMAAAVCVMVPIVVIFFMAQRYFVKGITLTGLKG
ncbi:MAG: carbohydrate ABC transporter permease [candidate division KSB1 bacterium]|nr:carbohydrate ABC transporter permease [candidate division KSB1 bacterium]MDZ7413738.1 carbohydrate ABC transporter permease [candidate division KSB1 bacterium]